MPTRLGPLWVPRTAAEGLRYGGQLFPISGWGQSSWLRDRRTALNEP